jgi:hypothetical protein
MTGGRTIALIMAGLAWGVSAVPARGQEVSQPESTRIGVLFDSDAPLRLRFEGDLRTLVKDRDSVEATYHPFTLTYRVGDASPVAVSVELKTRGHWRRQERNCDFPPLLLNLPRGDLAGTPFADQDKLKLVTPCQSRVKGYDEYVLREYVVQRVYNLLTPLSLRARLATTTYVDTTRRRDSLTVHTFLLEDAAQMAARNGGRLLEVGAEFNIVDSLQLGLVGVFLYMIGGTDWSLRGLHNMELVFVVEQGAFYPVAYDFDFTGIVNTVYARPDPRLRIRSVRERVYRGTCLTEEQWTAVLAPFRERMAPIYALYDTMPGLSPGYVKDTRRYLDEFYRVIDDPGKLSSEVIRRCRTAEGI